MILSLLCCENFEVKFIMRISWTGRGNRMAVTLSNPVTNLPCKVLFVAINSMWPVIGKRFGKRMLRTKPATFFGDYVGDAFQRGVVY
jgi:hypothetical protein